jgi:hypothetical protein
MQPTYFSGYQVIRYCTWPLGMKIKSLFKGKESGSLLGSKLGFVFKLTLMVKIRVIISVQLEGPNWGLNQLKN